MNSIENLKQYRKLSFSTLVFIITLIILSTLSSLLLSKANTQAQQLREHTTGKLVLLEEIAKKSAIIATEINYPVVDERKIFEVQSSIKIDIKEIKNILDALDNSKRNGIAFTFHQDIQEQIIKIVTLNIQNYIDEVEKLTSIIPNKQENQLQLLTAINTSSSTSRIIHHSLNYLIRVIQNEINKITSTLEIIYISLNLIILITVIILGKYLLYPSIKKIETSLQREKEEGLKLEHIANSDTLTGVGNRLKMNTFFKEFNKNSAPRKITFLLFDLNEFKPINDNYGHNKGDALLIHISKQLQSLEDENTQLYRIGGDEFCLIKIGDIPNNSLSLLAEKIINIIEMPLVVDGVTLRVGASIGIASANSNEVNFDSLMINADRAMYHAKSKQEASHSSLSTYELYTHLHERYRSF